MSFALLNAWSQPALWTALAYCLAVLAVVNALAIAHPKSRRHAPTRQAIQSWWPVILVAALGVLTGPALTLLVFSGVGIALVYESLQLLPLDSLARQCYRALGALLAMLIPLLTVYSPAMAMLVLLMVLFLLLPAGRMLWRGGEGILQEVAPVQWLLLASVGLFSFAASLVFSQPNTPYGGPGVAFVCFLLVIVADAMQWLGGKAFGRHLLIPRVSPKKTWEGLGFGMLVCSLVGAGVYPVLLQRPHWEGAIVGALVCLLALLGDLVVSSWKREAGVKDTGTVLPGQGGVLDRCDSMLFVAPCFWLYAQLGFAHV